MSANATQAALVRAAHADALRRCERVAAACAGLLSLLELVCQRNDLGTPVRAILQTHARVIEARAALVAVGVAP